MTKLNKSPSKGNEKPSKQIRVYRNQNKRLQICDLPTEILELIINNINIWHRNRIRASCKRLRNACDSALMHDFRASLVKYGRKDRCGYEFSALQVIHQATWAYVKAGFRPLFLGAMLPLMRNHYKNPFCPRVGKIRTFLLKFYKLIEEGFGNPLSQSSRLLYVITLLGFLYKSNNSSLVSSVDIEPQCWRMVYQLRGSWFGMLWSSKSTQCFNYVTDRNQLLIILAEIMISVHSRTAFKKVWECENKIFVLGQDLSNRKRMPKVTFSFEIHGTPNIISILKESPKSEEWINLPEDEFNLSLSINCKEAVKWGCYPTYRFEVGPYFDEDEISTAVEEHQFLENIEELL